MTKPGGSARLFGAVTLMLVSGAAIALLGGCRDHDGVMNVAIDSLPPTTTAYETLEVVARLRSPVPENPFVDAELRGQFEGPNGQRWEVDGFCDAIDGSVFRLRFAPPVAGVYHYSIEYRQGGLSRRTQGTFNTLPSRRRGPIRIDPVYPWHFIWEGTQEHYYFNGATAYWLFGWADDSTIFAALERLHRLKINRVRVTIAGRPSLLFGEPVIVDSSWTPYVTPWPAKNPADVYHPGFDYTRFFLPYWQKIDRAVRFARDRDIIVSLAFDMNDVNVHPEAGSDDERRYLRYAVARLGAFTNVTWDLGDDLDGFRDNKWAESTGRLVHDWDPQRHLATTHPRPPKTESQPRRSEWVGFTSLQNWSRDQHAFMLRQRAIQRKLGRIIPQANEEYGYEDHYPLWAPRPDSESAEVLRRTAWDIAMAGGYQTTGETAKRGTNVWPNTGGGWMNGRGDSTMTMLQGYAHILEFFTAYEWWKAEPHDELVSGRNYCLAEIGRSYALYLPKGGKATIRLEPGVYLARWFDPLTGNWLNLPNAKGSLWTSPEVPDGRHDWALLLTRQ